MKIGANGKQIMHVGDTVQYFPGKEHDEEAQSNGNYDGPVAAIVTRVWGEDGLVNLTLVPDMGESVFRGSVYQGKNEEHEGHGYYLPITS